MGIGVSYTGYDGTTKNFQAEVPNDLARMMPKIGERTAASVLSPRSPQRRSVQNAPIPKQDMVDGPLVGVEGNDSTHPDGQYRAVGSRGGWRIPITRTEMEVKPSLEMKCNEVTLVKLEYDLILSEAGYVKGRTEEKEVWRKSFFVLAEGSKEGASSGGVYGVRAFWSMTSGTDKPHLDRLGFGSEEDLATWNESEERFDCNYDESGNLVESPPVYMLVTSTCPYG